MKRSERYRVLKNKGYSLDSIKLIFNTPTSMQVFSWKGEIDTVITPMDSIKYYKHFLQAGMKIEDIQQFLGHASLESTQIYIHILKDE